MRMNYASLTHHWIGLFSLYRQGMEELCQAGRIRAVFRPVHAEKFRIALKPSRAPDVVILELTPDATVTSTLTHQAGDCVETQNA